MQTYLVLVGEKRDADIGRYLLSEMQTYLRKFMIIA